MITVEEVWARGLPPATVVAAGADGLGRIVSWVTTLRSRAPGFVGLKGGELALFALAALRELDGRLSLSGALERLAEAGVVAAAVRGEPPAEALATADRLAFPLLVLPDDADLHEVERQVTRLLVEQRSDLHRRGHEISSELNELIIEGRPVSALADRLATLLGRVVALELNAAEPHLAVPRGQQPDRALLGAALSAGRAALAAWSSLRRFSPSDPPVERFELPGIGWSRLAAPLALTDGVVGWLSVLAPATRLTPLDRLGLARGAAACAVALARERAVLATEDRLRRDLLEELLSDSPLDVAAVAGRAARLGYDFSLPHLALVIAVTAPTSGAPLLSQRSIAARRGTAAPPEAVEAIAALLNEAAEPSGAQPLLRREGACLVALLPLPAATEDQQARTILHRLREAMAARVQPLAIAVGAAGPQIGAAGLRSAAREAEQALALGQRLFGPDHLTHFDDLGLYRLLFRLHGTPEAEAFQREMLGALEAYDQEHGSDLIPTLEAYFAAGVSPKETAARLHLHRNTVLYRLQRIAEITGHRLDDPATSLSLQVALLLRQTLRAMSDAEPAPAVPTAWLRAARLSPRA